MKKMLKSLLILALSLNLLLVSACSDNTNTASGTVSGEPSVSSDESVSDNADTTSKASSTTSRLTDEEMRLQAKIPSNWSSKISTIKQKSSGKFVFALQSDTHFYDAETPGTGENLKALAYFTDLQFIGNLGDLVRGYSVIDIDSPDNMRLCMDTLVDRYTSGGKTPVLMTIGNHDANHMWSQKHFPDDYTTLITEKEHYSRVIAPLKEHNGNNMVTNGESTYYYMDFPDSKVRVIMLNTTDYKFSEGWGKTNAMSDEQVNWFKTKALDTDYAVIVTSHIPFISDFEGGENNPANKSDQILAAVEGFVANGGTFIAYMHGHTHLSETVVDDNGRVHLTLGNAGNEGKSAEVFVVDLENKIVETIGLGNAKDRTFRFF